MAASVTEMQLWAIGAAFALGVLTGLRLVVGSAASQSLAPRPRMLNSHTCDTMTDVANGVAIRPKESWDKGRLRRANG